MSTYTFCTVLHVDVCANRRNTRRRIDFFHTSTYTMATASETQAAHRSGQEGAGRTSPADEEGPAGQGRGIPGKGAKP